MPVAVVASHSEQLETCIILNGLIKYSEYSNCVMSCTEQLEACIILNDLIIHSEYSNCVTSPHEIPCLYL